MAVAEAPRPPIPAHRRRNSVAASVVIATKPTLPSTPLHSSIFSPHRTNGNGVVSSPPLAFGLASLEAYTSLKDILPSTAVNSPTAASSASRNLFRNRLVQQAAWAYLQPMSSSPDSSSQHFLLRFWMQFSTRNPITSCIRFVNLRVIPSITEAFDRILRAIRFRMEKQHWLTFFSK